MKTFALVLAVVCAIALPCAHAALVAHYDMEHAMSPIVDQAGGQTAAEVGSGARYVLAGPAGFAAAVGLTGNGAWQLSVPDSAELNLGNDLTVAAWVYIDSGIATNKTGLNAHFDRVIGDDEAWDADGWSFGTRDDIMLFTKNGVIDAADPSNTTIPYDQWIHLAASVSSSGGVTFYTNGVVTGVNGHTGNNNTGLGNNGVADPYGVGRSYGGNQAQWFPGLLDEVRVYDTVLSQPSIAALMTPPATAPVITVQPQDQFLPLGQPDVVVAFGAAVSGLPPISYQWTKDAVDIPGATDAVLVISNAAPANVGAYAYTASNVLGSATSDSADLILTTDPVFPSAQGILEGETATFSVSASAADSYQWTQDGLNVPGGTNQTLNLQNVSPSDAGAYAVVLTQDGESVTADPGILTILSPAGRSDYELLVLSDTPRGYWRLGETSGTTAVDETGLHDGTYWNSPVLGSPGVIAGDPDTAVSFTQVFSNKVDVPFSPDLNTESFSVECWAQTTGGTGHRSPLTSRDDGPQEGYILYAEPDNMWSFWTGPGWHDMNGIPATPSEWAHLVGTYDAATRVKTFYINGQIASSAVGVTVNVNDQRPLRIGGGATDDPTGNFFWEGPIDEAAVYAEALPLDRVRAHYLAGLYGGNSPPFIDGQPEDQFLVLGDTNATVTFSAVVNGSPPLFYQWLKNGLEIAGAHADSYTITNAVPADVGTYSLTVSNALATVTSDPADLTLTTGPVQPPSQVRIEGDNASFTVTMPEDSTGYVYQWKDGGVSIPGATNGTLDLFGLTVADTDDYTVEVTLGLDVATSDPVALTVVPLAGDTYANEVSTSSPLVWWRLGETAGASAAVDEVGFNDAGILTGTVMGVSGALLGDTDTAAEFRGAADSKVELFDTFDLYTPEFTVEFWAKMDGGAGFRSPVTSRDRFENPPGSGLFELSGWTFYVTSDNTWQFRIGDGGTEWAASIDGPPAVLGAWTHVVGTYDGSNVRLYVDGALVGEESGVPYLPQDFNPLWIGAGGTEDPGLVGDWFWVGDIDEVAFYDRGISADEVQRHWAAAFQPGTAPVITGEPQFAWVLPGGDTSFSVAARGTPLLQYQWEKDGIELPGATDSTLMLTEVELADAAFYSVVVSNSGGTASASAELYVPPPPAGAYQDMVLADGPVAYWPLDEASGAVAMDAAGANHGTIVNSPTLGEPGAIPGDAGTSYDFVQAAPASAQKVEVPYSQAMNPSNFTIEAWVRMDGGAGHRSPLTSRDDILPDNDTFGYIFYCAPDSSWQFWSGHGGPGWDQINWGQGSATAGQWYHLVGTYDGTTKSFYVDGQLVGSQNVNIAPNAQRVLRIGGGATDADPGDFFFDGAIDEVAVYDQVLDLKQIVDHYAAGAKVLPPLALMDISLQGGVVTVTWDDNGGVLQQSEALPADDWSDVPGDPPSPHMETVPVDFRSFRLREP